jgi:hypothetical protein
VTPADPERLEAELAAYQTARMPLEAAVSVSSSTSGQSEGAQPAIAAASESLSARPSEAAPEGSGRRPFWSLSGAAGRTRRREATPPQRTASPASCAGDLMTRDTAHGSPPR